MGERMRLRGRTKLALLAVLALAVGVLTASAGTATGASAAGTLVPKVGTGGPQTGAFTPWDGTGGDEFAEQEDEDSPDAYSGNILDPSLSFRGPALGGSPPNGKKKEADPNFVA